MGTPESPRWNADRFAERFKAAIDSVGLSSMRELSRLTDVNVQQISAWTRGTRPNPEMLERVAPALRLPAATLLVWAGWISRRDLRVTEGVADLPVQIQQLVELWQTGDRADQRELLAHTQIIIRALIDLRLARQSVATASSDEEDVV